MTPIPLTRCYEETLGTIQLCREVLTGVQVCKYMMEEYVFSSEIE